VSNTMKKIGFTGLLISSMVLAVSSANASTLAWYRMGDDDGGLANPPVDGAEFNATDGTLDNPLGSLAALVPSTGFPNYSTVVPGALIHNPQTGLNYANAWSFEADASESKERAASPAIVPGEGFSYEAFIRFDDVSAADGIRFAYHRTNADGGWLLELQSDGTIDAEFTHDTLASVTAFASTTTSLEDGRWYHIGLIWDGNSQDSSNDIHLFLDYAEEGSANYPDGTAFNDANTSFFNGEVFGQRQIYIDESRYLDGVDAATSASDFLTVVVPEPSTFVLLGLGLVALFDTRRGRHELSCPT